jgi:hypothetical protein
MTVAWDERHEPWSIAAPGNLLNRDSPPILTMGARTGRRLGAELTGAEVCKRVPFW